MTRQTRKSDRFKILLRSFAVQGSWNFKSLLGLGFCWCLLPVAERLMRTPEERSAFLRRHLEFFNSHPYFAGWCLGAVTRAEEEALAGMQTDKHEISLFKSRMSGPLGSLGDQLFWSRWRPLMVAAALCTAFLFGLIAVPLFLVFYNIPHLLMRWFSFKVGYRKGFNVIKTLSEWRFTKVFSFLSLTGLFFTGVFFIVAADWCLARDPSLLAAFVCSALTTVVLASMQKSVHLILFVAFTVSILIGWLFSLNGVTLLR